MNNRVLSVLCFTNLSILIALPITARGEPLSARRRAEVLEEFNIGKRGDLIVLPVTVAGKDYPFMLSTATDRILVDARLLPLLGEALAETECATPVGRISTKEFAPIPMKIGGIEFTGSRPLVCKDLSAAREGCGYDLYGVVGLDYLRGRIVQIDFDEGKFRVLASVPVDLPNDRYLACLIRSDRGYRMVMDYPGATIETVVVDTGMSTSVAARADLMRSLVRKRIVTAVQTIEFARDYGETKSRVGWLAELDLGKWKHRDLQIVEDNVDVLGLAYLARYQLIFDFKEEELHFIPGAHFRDPELCDWSGMSLRKQRGLVRVVGVEPKWPGARAGIEPGDAVLEANGERASQKSIFEIRYLFTQSAPVKLLLLRGETRFDTVLEPPATDSADK
jgi:hypothetical protein